MKNSFLHSNPEIIFYHWYPRAVVNIGVGALPSLESSAPERMEVNSLQTMLRSGYESPYQRHMAFLDDADVFLESTDLPGSSFFNYKMEQIKCYDKSDVFAFKASWTSMTNKPLLSRSGYGNRLERRDSSASGRSAGFFEQVILSFTLARNGLATGTGFFERSMNSSLSVCSALRFFRGLLQIRLCCRETQIGKG